jgi:predicted transposase YbfD/YdcC
MGTRLSISFIENFNELEDPRLDNHNRRHNLIDMLVITILGVICGADGWVEVATFGRSKYEWLKSFLELPNGIPSHDTFGRVFALLNPKCLEDCFLKWMKSLVSNDAEEIIAIDGKTLRRSYDRASKKAAIHMVSVWSSVNSVVLGQIKTEEKSNEITAIPELLDMLDISGCIVTIDAMGCQKEIVKKIVDKKGDYVLGLKGNQGTLHEDVKLYLEACCSNDFKKVEHDYYETIEKEHGRIDIRRYWTTSEIEWLENRNNWKNLHTICMVESERHVGNEISKERRFYISSLASNAKKIGNAVRKHWGVENSLHWSLDVTFNEDQCRIRKGHAAENLAVVRHIALNLLKQEKTAKVGLKIKRSKAGWDKAYLLQVLQSFAKTF